MPQSPNLDGAQRELTVRELIARDLPTQVEPTDPNANVPQKTMLPGVKRPRYLDVEGYDKCLDKYGMIGRNKLTIAKNANSTNQIGN